MKIWFRRKLNPHLLQHFDLIKLHSTHPDMWIRVNLCTGTILIPWDRWVKMKQSNINMRGTISMSGTNNLTVTGQQHSECSENCTTYWLWWTLQQHKAAPSILFLWYIVLFRRLLWIVGLSLQMCRLVPLIL